MDSETLRTWRVTHGWTQAQAARALGVNVAGYLKWEQGKRTCNPLLDLACAFIDSKPKRKAA